MKKKWKFILGALVVIIVIGFMVFERTKALEATVLEVQPGTIATTFKEEGRVVPEVEQPIYTIYGGEIVEVAVQEGQEVKAGDLLAVINSKELEFQLQQLYAQLKSVQGERTGTLQEPYESQITSQELLVEQAQRDLAAYKINFERIEQLYEAGAVTEKDFEDAKNMIEKAQNHLELQKQALALLHESTSPGSGTQQFYDGRIEALQAQINLLEYQKGQTNIVAPVDGVVSNLSIKKGEIVGPALPLMNIFRPDTYVVEVYVLTADVRSINIGMKVNLVLDGKGEDIIYEGTVRRIAPTAVERMSALGLEEQRVKVTVELSTSGDVKLFPGYSLDVEFTTDKRENVLTVPKTALFPYEMGDALWIIKDGKAKIQPVETGFYNNRDVVILDGLSEGDAVILNPQLDGLKEGKKVRSN
ncbi:MAG: efflux RND transporter periplasmic adaptor subunit [Bacillota bacterium]